MGISSLTDTWILLRDIELNGERNRCLYVLKSRGMAHSNQLREFMMSEDGIRLIPGLHRPGRRADRIVARGARSEGESPTQAACESRKCSASSSNWTGNGSAMQAQIAVAAGRIGGDRGGGQAGGQSRNSSARSELKRRPRRNGQEPRLQQ